MPFTKVPPPCLSIIFRRLTPRQESFAHGISDKIGIYTTQASKLASITHAYTVRRAPHPV